MIRNVLEYVREHSIYLDTVIYPRALLNICSSQRGSCLKEGGYPLQTKLTLRHIVIGMAPVVIVGREYALRCRMDVQNFGYLV